ncbi:MAG: helix-turn-helix transcriptional regulator [Firmicutes bacterium]|nr:helix-turn-helix transcriptional regulator [Bacillota bacterium]
MNERYKKINAEIGERVREMRYKKKLTQEELAEQTGISNSQQVSNIERGLSGMSIETLKAVCKALDVDADYLIFGISPKSADTVLSKYIKDMSPEQIANLLEMVKAYAKTCGINITE